MAILPNRAGAVDIINVKASPYGAVGNGSTDDTAAIQAAVDAAFGTSGAPHGTTATSNKPLYFPPGSYLISSAITFTQVKGALIFGAGQFTSSIHSTGSKCFVTDGMEGCCFENMQLSVVNGAGNVCVELDWGGSGSVLLKGNTFTNCNFSGGDYAVRIGLSGNGGTNNKFDSCFIPNSGVGIAAWSASATGNICVGTGVTSCTTAGLWAKDGQFSTFINGSLAGNTIDILMDSAGPIIISGTRTESTTFCQFTSASSLAVLEGCTVSSAVSYFCNTKGKAIIDCCGIYNGFSTLALTSSATYNGSVYMRGNPPLPAGFLTGFAGTLAQSL